MNDEPRLHEVARRLGAGAAERLDVERTAAAVVARLRAERVTRRPLLGRFPAALRIAAAVALLLGGGLVARGLLERSPGHNGAGHYVADELSGFSETELEQLLTSLDETLDLGTPADAEPSLDELSEEQLRTMLRSLEGEG